MSVHFKKHQFDDAPLTKVRKAAMLSAPFL